MCNWAPLTTTVKHPTMVVNSASELFGYNHSSKYFSLYKAEKVGTTLG